jgi:hypothetical protein
MPTDIAGEFDDPRAVRPDHFDRCGSSRFRSRKNVFVSISLPESSKHGIPFARILPPLLELQSRGLILTKSNVRRSTEALS